jgi:prevent-host-death family protein
VGADEFRAFFSRYMERARDGEEFLITRRGKAYARLIPPDRRPLSLVQDPEANGAILSRGDADA